MDAFFGRCPVHGRSILLPSLVSASLSPGNRVRESLDCLRTVEVPVVRVRKGSVRTKETFQAPNPTLSSPTRKASPHPSFKLTGTRYFRSPFHRATIPDKDCFLGMKRKDSVLIRSLVLDQQFQAKEVEITSKYATIRLKKRKIRLNSMPPALVFQRISPKSHSPG